MTDLNDQDVRDILRAHRDGGPISRLYATGEITEHTVPAINKRAGELFYEDQDEEAARLHDVIEYVTAVGARPAVARWVDKPAPEQAG
ncbi:hypothetical protein [Streptomyces murinus]|uniref:hypothetical protein n=1 Tax=Streptomyces murinus TaxID=33900 RepID=UPI0018F33881|nr:hypothetical protein [Streptomyces murinus]